MQKLGLHAKKNYAAFALAFLTVSFGLAMAGSVLVYADPPDSDLTTQRYCKAHIDNSAQSACTTKNMDKLRAVFSDSCKGNGQAACVEKGAEGLIDQIAKQKPKNASDFNAALTLVVNNNQPSGNGSSNNSSNESTDFSSNPGGSVGPSSSCNSSDNCDLIKLYLNPAINILSIIIGLVVAGSLIMGGIQYSSSSGDPQKISAAKNRISNTLLALFAYAFLYAFLNFLVPGGILHP